MVRDMINTPKSLDTVKSNRSRRGDNSGEFSIGFILLNGTNEFVLVLTTARKRFDSRFVAWQVYVDDDSTTSLKTGVLMVAGTTHAMNATRMT